MCRALLQFMCRRRESFRLSLMRGRGERERKLDAGLTLRLALRLGSDTTDNGNRGTRTMATGRRESVPVRRTCTVVRRGPLVLRSRGPGRFVYTALPLGFGLITPLRDS